MQTSSFATGLGVIGTLIFATLLMILSGTVLVLKVSGGEYVSAIFPALFTALCVYCVVRTVADIGAKARR